MYLFNASDGDLVFHSLLSTFLFQVVINFAGTENQFLNAARAFRCNSIFRDHSSEFGT